MTFAILISDFLQNLNPTIRSIMSKALNFVALYKLCKYIQFNLTCWWVSCFIWILTHFLSTVKVFTWAKSFILNKTARIFIMEECYYDRFKTKILLVFSNTPISFPRKTRKINFFGIKKKTSLFFIHHSRIPDDEVSFLTHKL